MMGLKRQLKQTRELQPPRPITKEAVLLKYAAPSIGGLITLTPSELEPDRSSKCRKSVLRRSGWKGGSGRVDWECDKVGNDQTWGAARWPCRGAGSCL